MGKTVGKLRKHPNQEIAAASQRLVDAWKAAVDPHKQRTPASTPPSSTDTSTHTDTSTPPTQAPGSSAKRKATDDQPSPPPKRQKENKGSSGQDADREKIVSLLVQALGEKREDDVLNPEDVAREIEESLFQMFRGVTREYKAKYRSISFNLRNPKNPDLRANVMKGNISGKKLCEMSPQEMASEELKRERARIASWHLEAAKAVPINQTSTDMFKCGKCGGRETTYYQMQTRR